MHFFDSLVNNFTKTFITESRYKLFLSGLEYTIIIAICSIIIGFLIGLFVAIMKVYYFQHKPTGKHGKLIHFLLGILNKILTIYTTVIRGTPTVVQLLITYYIIFASSSNDLLIAIFAFGVNSGAYMSEIFRAGILAVDKGQTEAGRSLGLSHFSTMLNIILPQAFKNILPALGNEIITILKETSVAGYVALADLTKAGSYVRSRTYEPYFSLLSIAGVYLIIVMGIAAVFEKIERRLAKSDRN